MNILLIGIPFNSILDSIQRSNLLDKVYIAGTVYLNTVPNIEFKTIPELIQKAKALQIDVAINLDNTLISENICEEFRRNKINLISVNKKWMNLETNRLATKQLLNHYAINNSKILKLPLKFPVVIKTENSEILADSMQDLTHKLEGLEDKAHIEEFLNGEDFDLLSLWDGKNIYCFNSFSNLTEVQKDRFDLFKTKLSFMLSDENADFTGFFTTHLLWTKNDWYVKSFSIGVNSEIDIKSALAETKTDFLYILNSAIYQKLNEIR